MAGVRHFQAEDADVVADMFQRLLRKSAAPASADLRAYLRSLFDTPAGSDPEMGSRVYTRKDGSVSGFLGVLPVAMELNGRRLKAANCGTFVSDDRHSDPYAGAKLLRAVLAGPQDLSFTETSNAISTELWRTARAHVLAPYSLEWLSILRPASFALTLSADKVSPLRWLSPLARLGDRIALKGSGQKWWRYRPEGGRADALVNRDCSDADFARIAGECTGRFALRPVWGPGELEAMLTHARRKVLHGTRVQRMVTTKTGKPLGVYLYYGDAGGIGRVVQIIAQPGQEELVIESLLREGHGRGLAALRGRTQPNLLQAMIGRRFAFLQGASTIAHTRDPDIAAALAGGNAFINGLVGEGWTRLIGDRFDEA